MTKEEAVEYALKQVSEPVQVGHMWAFTAPTFWMEPGPIDINEDEWVIGCRTYEGACTRVIEAVATLACQKYDDETYGCHCAWDNIREMTAYEYAMHCLED